MTFEEFDKYSEELLIKVRGMRDGKGKEYANSVDRFDNFNRLSKRMGMTRLQVAGTYLVKHLDGIESFIKNGRTFSEERIEGRIVDAITYLSLIAGIIHEDDLLFMQQVELDIALAANEAALQKLEKGMAEVNANLKEKEKLASPRAIALGTKIEQEISDEDLLTDIAESFISEIEQRSDKDAVLEKAKLDAYNSGVKQGRSPFACTCKGIAIPDHITHCPICGLYVNHSARS